MESIIELNDTNIKQSCRTCLKLNAEEMISIFDKIELIENDDNVYTCIYDMLIDVTLIELDRKESLPTLICINCLRLARQLFKFRNQCNRSQAILLKYVTKKDDKLMGMLSTKKDTHQHEGNVNKISAINESIDVGKSLNEDTPESINIKNEVCELSNPSSSDDLFNASIKLEFGDEIIKSCTEKEDKIIGILDTRNPNHGSNFLNKKSIIKESITNDVNELSNTSNSDDLLSANIKLEFVDEIIKSETESECKETPHSEVFTCRLCDETFTTETLYFAHKRKHGEEKYVCDVCNAPFIHRSSLNAHMKTHTEDKRFVCKVCNEKFVYRRAFNAHMKQHSENEHESYVCAVCSKHFDHRRYLVAHMRTHKDEKRYSCKICGKQFKQSSSITPHMRTHTGQKPFSCSVCGIEFTQAQILKIHMRSHTGDAPYKCTECSKAFTSSTRLKRHFLVHTGIKPYSCDVCKKSFNRKHTLTLHTKMHTDDRPHACLICGKKFIQAHCLNTHLQTHAQ